MTATPLTVGRETYQKQVDQLRVREKAHTREGDAIAAAPAHGRGGPHHGTVSLLDTFEGRTQLFAAYHMWHTGLFAAD
jgi:predicted dithiol-disulfide oxidoreductase (DUF899 family)